MDNEEISLCPQCGKILTGVLEIIKTTTLGVPSILFRETFDRNWIECDGCNLIICKACCQKPAIGFCNDCYRKLQTEGLSKTPKQSATRSQNQLIGGNVLD